MYKNNPYLANTKLELNERDKRIVAKAKKYHISNFENPSFAHNLLHVKPKNGSMTQDIVDFFAWIIKQENSLQMSKDKE